MNKAYILIILLLPVVFIQCKSSKVSTTSGMLEETKVETIKKNFTAAQMEEGRILWQDRCDNCHKLFKPESYTVNRFDKVLPRMTKRSKMTEEEAAKVRAYLLVNAKRST